MVKKMVSIATAFLMLCCMIPFAAFSDDILDTCPKCGERTYETWTDCSTEVPDIGFPISVKRRHCTSCDYTYYDWNCLGFTGYKEFDKGSGVLLADYLKDWRDKTFGKNAASEKLDATNGGANIPAPGGRNPKGYGDEGVANVTASGVEVLWVEPFGISGSLGSGFYSSAPQNLLAGSSSSGTQYFDTSCATVVYYFVAPVSGLYYLGSAGNPYDFGVFNYFSSNTWKSIKIGLSLSNAYQVSCSLNKGDKQYYCYTFSGASTSYGISQKPYKFNLNKIPIFIEPLGDSSITTTNNITINNNTWNGNIYTDSSTSLTYIYPQYTTINEKNETVTNISTTPIIYNNETKQYYTYDQTTKNYYYITYNSDPTPSPTPTPDPTDKQGGSISTPETGKPGNSSGSSWWDKLLSKIGDAIIDGLLGAVSAVLKLIFKLFSTILSWIIWAVSRVFDLLPFLPPGLGGLLVGGVVVCFVIGIIKFIRG